MLGLSTVASPLNPLATPLAMPLVTSFEAVTVLKLAADSVFLMFFVVFSIFESAGDFGDFGDLGDFGDFDDVGDLWKTA